MDEWVKALKDLQDVDISIGRLTQAREEALKVIVLGQARLAENEAKIADMRKKVDQLENDRKNIEKGLKTDEENIKKWENQLRDLKNFREYQALNREIALARKDNSLKEESILKTLEEEEKIVRELQELEKTHTESQAAFANEKSETEKKIQSLEKDVAAANEQQKNLRVRIAGSILSLYDRIRKQRNGVALVNAEDGVCHGCNMNIPPQTVNLVRKKIDIQSCPNCQRILYWEEIPA